MKVMNVVFGIGIAVLLFIVVMLGTQVFYEEPVYDEFCNISYYTPIYVYDFNSCPQNITVGECNMLIKNSTLITAEKDKEMQECNNKFMEAQKVYGKNLFIINNIVGIIAVVVSLFLFSMVNIAAGTAFAGLVLIIYGFARGWQGTGDILKFIVALIVAGLFISFAVIVNRRYSEKPNKIKIKKK